VKFEEELVGVTKEEFDELLRDTRQESDRGLIVTTIALIDDILFRKVSRVLRHGSAEARARLLKPPLGSISGVMAKADLAYCLGLYPKSLYDDIRRLNRLRIKCAHEWRFFRIDEAIVHKYVEPMDTYRYTAAVERFFIERQMAPWNDPNANLPRLRLDVTCTLMMVMANQFPGAKAFPAPDRAV
jgi:hypothetical protein